MPEVRKQLESHSSTHANIPRYRGAHLQHIYEWLYRHKISIATQGRDFIEELIKACAFGMRIEDADFCNSILVVIIEQMQDDNARIHANHVTMAYTMTTEHCGLRELYVEIYKMLGPEADVCDDFWGALPTPFLRDLCEAYTEDSPRVTGTEMRNAILEDIKNSI
jgi:hypothetical protein